MNILIIGSGAREHAIARALQRSPQRPALFCFGTSVNPGIQALTESYAIGDITDVNAVRRFVEEQAAENRTIDLAIIGPEAPLEKGLADTLWQMFIPTVGPKKKLAQIETSKAFARDLMRKYRIPGLPAYRVFQDLTGVKAYLAQLGEDNYVIKANGIMGGKGVKVAGEHLSSFAEAMLFCEEIIAHHQSFIIEEKLIGQEFSFMCFCDGEHIVPMPLVQDHKRAFIGDRGPNTGGMGSYSTADHRLPFLTEEDVNSALRINTAVMRALLAELGENYRGILYGGFMATRYGVSVIEFNARFGDPEALNVLTLLESDFLQICQAVVQSTLSSAQVRFSHLATVCKYAVPQGYPDKPIKNVPIDISAVKDKAHLYLGSVNQVAGELYATGSRTAAFVGVAKTLSDAEVIAEEEVQRINGPLFHREDIGTDALIHHRATMMQQLREQII